MPSELDLYISAAQRYHVRDFVLTSGMVLRTLKVL